MPFVKSPLLTPRKLAANRANARHSTGPRTYRGKCRVALNALRHGRFASPKFFRSRLLSARDDVALYDWVYAQAADAFGLGNPRARSDAERVARQVWCLVREGSQRDIGKGWQKAGRQGGPTGGQRGCAQPSRASLWCSFRIPTRMTSGFGTNPRYTVKSLDTRITSRIRFTVHGPYEGFRTNLRLKFWVPGRRHERIPLSYGVELPLEPNLRRIDEVASLNYSQIRPRNLTNTKGSDPRR